MTLPAEREFQTPKRLAGPSEPQAQTVSGRCPGCGSPLQEEDEPYECCGIDLGVQPSRSCGKCGYLELTQNSSHR